MTVGVARVCGTSEGKIGRGYFVHRNPSNTSQFLKMDLISITILLLFRDYLCDKPITMAFNSEIGK